MKKRHQIIQRHVDGRRQRGAAAIEFALLFTVFFAVFYAAVGYGTWFLLKQGLTQAATNGARAALRVSPLDYTDLNYTAAITAVATTAVTNSLTWAPTSVLGSIGITVTPNLAGTTVPASNTTNILVPITQVKVQVSYSGAPLIPVLNLPVIGPVPNLPANLLASATAVQ